MDAHPRALRAVKPLNDLLRQELGEPRHSWQWSEALTIKFRDREAGYTHQADPRTGLIHLVPAYLERTVCSPEVVDRWVLCTLVQRSLNDWLQNFSDDMIWPENGRWTPICGELGYVALGEGITPNYDSTWRVIRLIKANREETAEVLAARLNARQQAAERQRPDKIRDQLEDIVPKLIATPDNTIYTFGASASGESKGN